MVTLESNIEMTAEFLQAMQEKYNINFDDVQDYMNEKKLQQILEQHPWNIWLAEDGRHKTWVKDEKKPKGRRLIAKSTKEKVEDYVVNEYLRNNQEKKVKYTVEYVYNKWTEFALNEGDIEKNTVDRYRNDYDKYIAGTDFSLKEVGEIKEEDVIGFIKDVIKGKAITRKNYSNIKTLLNGIFSYALSEIHVKCISMSSLLKDYKIPDKKFKKVIVKDEDQVYSEEDVLKIAEYIIGNYTSTRELGVLLTFLTGLRNGELAALKNVDIQSNMLYIQRTEIKYKNEDGKTIYDVRDFPKTESSMSGIVLTDSASRVISMIMEHNISNGITSEYLFYENEHGRLKSYFFSKTLKKICTILGIKFRSMHKVRKTYASYLFANSVEEKIAQAQLRHKSSATTHKYYEFAMRTNNYVLQMLNKSDILQKIEEV